MDVFFDGNFEKWVVFFKEWECCFILYCFLNKDFILLVEGIVDGGRFGRYLIGFVV